MNGPNQREEDPPRPSTRLTSLAHEEQTTIARPHQSDTPRLIRLMLELLLPFVKGLGYGEEPKLEIPTGQMSFEAPIARL